MKSDEEQQLEGLKIDVDLIKDEQNPIYQSVNIQRQRLISVFDRALEKIGIAYALDEMLGENVNVLRNYVTQAEIDSILNTFKFTRRLEDVEYRNKRSFENKNKSLMKYYHINSKYSTAKSYQKSTTSFSKSKSQSTISVAHSVKGCPSHSQVVQSFYNSIIAQLNFIPGVANFAKSLVYKKPVRSIKYYIYLKDLRDHVFKIIYETKTDEVNYQKSVKRAYVKNLKEKPQAEVIDKLLQDKQKERNEMDLQIKKDIENEKLLQAEMNTKLLNEATKMINISEDDIVARTEANIRIQEHNKLLYASRQASYNKDLAENIAASEALRKRNQKLEVTLKKIIENYDSTIGALHEVYETINDGFMKVEALYNDVKQKYDAQLDEYVELMEEKKLYVEMTCLRIRYNRSAKIIQHWWREILFKRWRWRKTYLTLQLKRRSLSTEHRQKMKKALKKIKAKQAQQANQFKKK